VAGAAAWLVESVLAALAGLAVGLAVVAAHAVLVPPVARLLGR
jgi:hypothetical protein